MPIFLEILFLDISENWFHNNDMTMMDNSECERVDLKAWKMH